MGDEMHQHQEIHEAKHAWDSDPYRGHELLTADAGRTIWMTPDRAARDTDTILDHITENVLDCPRVFTVTREVVYMRWDADRYARDLRRYSYSEPFYGPAEIEFPDDHPHTLDMDPVEFYPCPHGVPGALPWDRISVSVPSPRVSPHPYKW